MSSNSKRRHRKVKTSTTTSTLYDYFGNASSNKRKLTTTVTHTTRDVIVIDSDSEVEVGIAQVVHKGIKRRRLSGSSSDIEIVEENLRVGRLSPAPSHAGPSTLPKQPLKPAPTLADGDFSTCSFGAPRLLLNANTASTLISAVDPPSSTKSSTFGIPNLLLQSTPTQTHETLLAPSTSDSQCDETSIELDMAAIIGDDWGTGDDETALARMAAEPEAEEELEDMPFTDLAVSAEYNNNNTDGMDPNVIYPAPASASHQSFSTLPLPNEQSSAEPTRTDNDAFAVLMSSRHEDQAWKEVSIMKDRSALRSKANGKGNGNRRKAPFYKVLQGMPIAVDAFCYGSIPGINAYFLTHAHSDHYTNLASNWKSGPIYCSEGTANLIVHMLSVDRKWVHALPMDVPTIIPNSSGVTVTLIEANHCPGSSMFFFEGRQTVNAGDSSFQSSFVGSSKVFRYLHCGDFRASPQHVLHPAVKGKHIDHVYLDTTYLDPKYTFPPQPLVISACAELARRISCGQSINSENNGSIDSWMKSANGLTNGNGTPKTLFVVGTYSIGKERVAKAVARTLDSKIYCDARKTAILRCQGDPELHALLTSNPLDARVHLLPLGMVTSDKLKIYLEKFKGTFGKIAGFRPTGWTFTPAAGSDLMPSIPTILSRPHKDFMYSSLKPSRQSTSHLQVFPVPYSEHSSFFELTCFAMSFDWGKMIATVNVGTENSRGKIAKWIAKWQAERKKRGVDEIIPHGHPEYW